MEDDSGDKALAAVRGLWLSGARESAVYCGVEAQSFAYCEVAGSVPECSCRAYNANFPWLFVDGSFLIYE